LPPASQRLRPAELHGIAAFVDEVTEDGESGWRATKGGQDFILRVAMKPKAGTVDYLREIRLAARGVHTCERYLGLAVAVTSS
jgi:hypothetical protein